MARNQQNDNIWNENHRSFNSDDRIMRRGDDRTIESQDWGARNERNSYRTDDYPTDKQMSRDQRPNRGYNWSSDYSATNDYRPSYDQNGSSSSGSTRDNGWSADASSNSWRTRGQSYDSNRGSDRWMNQDTQGFDRTYGRSDNMYGQGGDLSNANRNYGGSTNFGSATSDSLRSSSNYDNYGNRSYGRENNAGNQFGGGYFGSGYGSSNYGSNYYGSSSSYGAGIGTGSYSGANTSSHAGKGPKNYKRSDDRIKEDVSDMLERNPQIDASEIELDVKDGVVTLRGHVEDRRTKRMAEDAIENMVGVKDIRNELQVDQSLFQQAKNALFGESAESQSPGSGTANKSTSGKSRH